MDKDKMEYRGWKEAEDITGFDMEVYEYRQPVKNVGEAKKIVDAALQAANWRPRNLDESWWEQVQ